MTERLSTLLHEEATDLDIPVPEVPVVLHRGRGLRRRRRVTTATAVAAVLVLIGGGIATALTISGTDRAQDPLPTGSFGSTGAFSVGQRLYLGGREIAWDEPIKALYYTSAGVVVRSGEEEFTDSAGPSHYTLVAPDGEQTPVEINAGDRILGFEPDSTHVAYAEPDGKAWDVVVQDVVTGEELSRSSVTGTFTWGGWEAPPVALDGDWVWVHFDDGWLEVGWSSERILASAAPSGPTTTPATSTRSRTATTPTGTARPTSGPSATCRTTPRCATSSWRRAGTRSSPPTATTSARSPTT